MKRFRPSKAVPILIFICSGALLLLFIFQNKPSFGLEYYLRAEQLDPIFAIQGTDPAKLTEAAAAFLAQKDQFAVLPGADKSLLESIYPSAFLTRLPELEAARQTLLSSSTVEHASAYHELLVQTITDYAAGARALSGSLANSGKSIPKLGYIEGDASLADLSAKLNQVADLAMQQKQKEMARFACIERYSTRCTSLSRLKSARDTLLETPATLPQPDPSVYKADALTQKVLPYFAYFSSVSKTIFAIPSSCYPQAVAYEREYYLAPYQSGTARKLSYINDVYFHDIPRSNLAVKTAFNTALQKVGIDLYYQSIGNLYDCPDSGFDVIGVGSLLGVLNALTQKESPTPAEKKLLSMSVVQKADVAPYVKEVAKVDTPEAQDIVERYIEGSADYDQILLGAHSDNVFLQIWNRDQSVVTFDFLLTARNFASTLFLMGNPTFVPKKISLFSARIDNRPDKVFLRTYLTDVSKVYTDQEIVAQIKKGTDISIQMGLRLAYPHK